MSGSLARVMRVVGIGNPMRGDDGVGPEVVRELGRRGAGRLAELVEEGDPAGLVGLSAGAALLVVVDALVTRLPPGTVLEPDPIDLARLGRPASSHGLGVREALELAERLEPDPGRQVRVVAVAIGGGIGAGPGLSPAVAAAVGKAADRIAAMLGFPGGDPPSYGTGATRGAEATCLGGRVEGTGEP